MEKQLPDALPTGPRAWGTLSQDGLLRKSGEVTAEHTHSPSRSRGRGQAVRLSPQDNGRAGADDRSTEPSLQSDLQFVSRRFGTTGPDPPPRWGSQARHFLGPHPGPAAPRWPLGRARPWPLQTRLQRAASPWGPRETASILGKDSRAFFLGKPRASGKASWQPLWSWLLEDAIWISAWNCRLSFPRARRFLSGSVPPPGCDGGRGQGGP